MTDLDALRAYIALDGGTVTERTLLAEVDRLTAENGRIRSFSTASRGAEHERARIRAEVEARKFCTCATGRDHLHRFAIAAAIEGESMSIDDIRKRDAEDIDLRAAIPWATALRVDVRALLDEVDQLRAALFVSEERVALIREAVVELEFGACAVIDSISRDKVLDIIEGTKS